MGFTEDDTKQDRGIDVDVQRSPRSSKRRSVELIFQPARLRRRSRISEKVRLGGRTQTRLPGWRGTIRAMGRSRSVTTTLAPFSTARRCSDNRSFSSAIFTLLMAIFSHKPRGIKAWRGVPCRSGRKPHPRRQAHALLVSSSGGRGKTPAERKIQVLRFPKWLTYVVPLT